MNIGFWSCMILVPGFLLVGLLFAILKEKAVKFVAGFNSLSEEQQALYDKAYICRDIRNQCFLWSGIMFAGSVFSYIITPYMAVVAYIIWFIVFFKDVHFDVHKAFEKYLIQ